MSSRRFVVFALALAALPGPVAYAQERVLTALDYRVTVPATWQSRAPSSSMRLAEYVIQGDAPNAEVVVYFFGQGQGGSPEANIERWRGQFAGTPTGAYEKIERDTKGHFPITVAEWRGSYARGIGAGGEARPGQALIAAIVETPKGTLFFQLFGPAAKVAAERQAYLTMARGLK